jgi:tryptophanyl-tRNA synthetase
MKHMKETIVSGIQPTGEFHLGNYLATIKDYLEIQETHECYFFIADLHSLSEDFDPKEKTKQILDVVITLLAAGIDPSKATLFIQSHVPAHATLFAILNALAPMGELERMTQYKDKAKKQNQNINASLFAYPVLMAADIMLYKPAYVPVGHDQLQHLELTNTLIRKFNHRFGDTFKEIKAYAKKPLRIMSLSNPERKMSKSEPGSYIGIFDEPDVIQKKMAKAVTATDAPAGEIPRGVANLFELLGHFGSEELVGKYKKDYDNNTIKYSELKGELAEVIANYFAPMREKKKELEQNQTQVMKVLEEGAEKARKVANSTLGEVTKKIGLL